MGIPDASARHPSHHRAGSRAVVGGLVVLAALTVLVPLPAGALAAWRAWYAATQPWVTGVSGRVPVAGLDAMLGAAALTLAASLRGRRGGRVGRVATSLVQLAASAWLVFLAAWGWHYQVPTIETRLALTATELSEGRGEAFARATVAQLNALHGTAHASPWPDRQMLPATLGPQLGRALRGLGLTWMPAWPVPKRSVLDWYFRTAGIDGMTNPFGLDVVLNSRILPFELPALAAHEYAHLAGFADESDASVVAWLACQAGPPQLRYSSALAVLPHVLTGLPPPVRAAVLQALAEGPRHDLQAIAARLQEQRPWLHAMAWQTYDRFLKVNRVEEGVARYDAVARVLVGAADPVTGRLLRAPRPWPPRP